MSIATEISRIQTARNAIRAKLTELGLSQSTDNLTKLATAVESIEDRGAVSANVMEGETYTIPKGYHNGSGTVSGVSGGGNYNLQSKMVTPTKNQQNVTPDLGYFGLSDVTVGAIPEIYQDVSSVTAAATDVLSGKVFVRADGTVTTGGMVNNGAVAASLSLAVPTYTIPAGYHNGQGSVGITTEEKTVTPTKSVQKVTAAEGKVLGSVSVAAIPEQFIDTTDTDATAAEILAGKTAYVNGVKLEGTMTDHGVITGVIDGLTTAVYTLPAGYIGGGTVTLNGDIESALAAI